MGSHKPSLIMFVRILLIFAGIHLGQAQLAHFFGPPAVGFGVGLVSVHRNFPVATSIVSRRSSRSYSQQSFVQSTPFGTSSTNRRSYTSTDHFYAANNLNYFQPNIFYYHSTPWNYRWGRSTDKLARQRREERLIEIGDIDSIPVSRISDVAANVSIAYKDDIWQNDMIFKDQDDCSKRLICELNSRRREGKSLSETEAVIADTFGTTNELDVADLSLPFNIAAVLGREVGGNRCVLSYRRCETTVEKMIEMIDVELKEIEGIQKEVDNGAITVDDIQNRLNEEADEVESLSLSELSKTTTTTTTTTTTEKPYYPPGKLPLLAGK